MHAVPAPEDAHALRAAIATALDGGPPVATDLPLPGPVGAAVVPEGTALLVTTSGSTGTPRTVALRADALVASATATHARLGGPGQWLLALPTTHVAGLQVIVRSHVAGVDPVVPTPDGPRGTGLLVDLVRRAGPGRRYASLVPTQLHRVLTGATAGHVDGLEALDALRTLDAILVGGAATPPATLAQARDHGLRVVTTYGMSETCGGCVYDGVPLPGVDVRQVGGVLEIAGPVLAAGYVGPPGTPQGGFTTDPATGRRWFRTNDLGTVTRTRATPSDPSGSTPSRSWAAPTT
ncbi:AMP-binding protein [Paraoerskovia sediminicola]|nr:AMP-binding protein [Paraoerskovia sediminicola]